MAKSKLFYYAILFNLLAFAACKNEDKKPVDPTIVTEDPSLPLWAKDAVIYEVNIRQYTKEGTFNAFSDHLPRLKEMGVDILWLMPIFPISTTNKKGTLGSYYAVSDFRAVNPEFGSKEDLINLIDKIHAYGMKVIFDWVPNHTGWDHKWMKTNPDFYTKDSLGKITDPLNDEGKSMGWTDVADLNYDNTAMRNAMIADMLYWVDSAKIDGYRMDVAWGVPNDFWKTVSDTLKKSKKDIFMLAEADKSEQVNDGYFNSCYGWKLHHIMNDVAKGKKNVDSIMTWFNVERPKIKNGQIMHFITNHDENSWAGSEFERMGDGVKAFAVMAMTFDGIPLMYSGQEEPLVKRLQFFEKDNINFEKFKDLPFYQTIFKLKKDQEALWNGTYGANAEPIAKSDYVLAYKRQKGSSKVVAILNLSGQIKKATFTQDVEPMWDVFKLEETKPIKAGDVIELKPWEYRLLQPKG
jgi:glycosidase